MVEKTAIIRNVQGIHCRPSSAIVKVARDYPGQIVATAKGGQTDLKSVLGLLMLGLEHGHEVRLAVTGPDEEAFCRQLVDLFETDFDFPPRDPAASTDVFI